MHKRTNLSQCVDVLAPSLKRLRPCAARVFTSALAGPLNKVCRADWRKPMSCLYAGRLNSGMSADGCSAAVAAGRSGGANSR